jgi:Na+/H+-dicarboxylate symporter
MFRTVVNVSGDAACAVYIASSEGELKTVELNTEDK